MLEHKKLEERINFLLQKLSSIESDKKLIASEIEQLKNFLLAQQHKPEISYPNEHIKLYMELFKGREDVFAKRWENLKTGKSGYSPVCRNEWVKNVCKKPQIKCSQCSNQAFISLTPELIEKHLKGDQRGSTKYEFTIGIYPMLKNESCRFLAVDFDKKNWQQDTAAFIKTCTKRNIPVSLERSRSGNGGHIWIFFSEPIPAAQARALGTILLTETMESYAGIGFESYDRFFPNQDTIPAGGFGNLIALPLQWLPTQKQNSLFLNENFEPYADQWTYLKSIRRMTPLEVSSIVEKTSLKRCIIGVRIPVEDEQEKPWEKKTISQRIEISPDQKLPSKVTVVLSNQLYVEKASLPHQVINKLIRLAAFQNPEFYSAQAMRLSTFNKPRIISCAENFTKYVGLPRGCLEEAVELLKSLNIEVILEDKRSLGKPLESSFLGELTQTQIQAVDKLLTHDIGVLEASTGFGKTVVAAHIIAKRKVNTLVILHRRQLLDQWVTQLQTFLDISKDQIGIIGGGKRKPTGIIDIAIIQSLVRNKTVDSLIKNYGQIIIDECHHLSAISFEAVARASEAKYVLGLTATTIRKDGHQPIVFMQCGSIRYKVDPKLQADLRPFFHRVIIRPTTFEVKLVPDEKPTIQNLYAALSADEIRNNLIFEDVLKVLKAKRIPLLLTERKNHAMWMAEKFSQYCKNVIVMVGGQTTIQRKNINQQLASIPEDEERLIIATGKYIGEGFDDPRIDTLFLTMPISWQGTLTQYAGRLHRLHHRKKEVIIYDYVDKSVSMLERMATKRAKVYHKLGYMISSLSIQ